MSWLTSIVTGEPDEYTHARLVKYGIGTHPGPRAVLKLSKARIAFKADLDMEKVFINVYLQGVPDGSQKIKGLVVTYQDNRATTDNLTMPVAWKVSKGKVPTYKAKLNEVAPLGDIKQLVELDSPTTFFLLSMNPAAGGTWKITTKASFPKGPAGDTDDADPAKKEKDPVFTKGAFENSPETLELLLNALMPDIADKIGPKTKSIFLKHILHIDDIEIPDDPSLSFNEKRKLAKKRGRLIRRITIDGETTEKEYAFLA